MYFKEYDDKILKNGATREKYFLHYIISKNGHIQFGKMIFSFLRKKKNIELN